MSTFNRLCGVSRCYLHTIPSTLLTTVTKTMTWLSLGVGFKCFYSHPKNRPKIIQFDDHNFFLNGWLHHQLDYISELELHFQILWLVSDAPDFEAHCLFWGAEDRNDEQVQSRCFKYILVFLSSFTSTRQKKHLPMSPCVFLGWKLFIAFNFQPILSFLLAPSLFPRASAAKSTGDVFTLGDPPRSGPSLTPWKAGGKLPGPCRVKLPFISVLQSWKMLFDVRFSEILHLFLPKR